VERAQGRRTRAPRRLALGVDRMTGRSHICWRTTLTLALAASLTLALVLAAQAAIDAKLVSKKSNGTAANGNSFTDLFGNLSGDGKLVTFHSQAANLPGGDGSTNQVYVRSIGAGKTRLMSKDNDGDPAGSDVQVGAISSNGRFVAFYGYGSGLPGASGYQQVWIRDRETGKTRLVSKANDGDPGDNGSYLPALSAGGRYVAFYSEADNLPGGPMSGNRVYVRDTKRGKTILVSRTKQGDPATGATNGQAISSDGRLVIFESSDADLPGGDGTTSHVYLRNLRRGSTKLVDRNSLGGAAASAAHNPSISGNGRFIAFDSSAVNLPAGDGTTNQVYRRDLDRGKTKLVSRNHAGDPQDLYAQYGHVSGDGRYVVFLCHANNMPGNDGQSDQVYARDLRKGKTRLLSRDDSGDPAEDGAQYPSISRDGRFASFYSHSDNLGGDPNYYNAFRSGPIG
jgi:Tol biopolymer transport system component